MSGQVVIVGGFGPWGFARPGSSHLAEQPAPKWDVPKDYGAGRTLLLRDGDTAAIMHPQGPAHLLKFSWTRCSFRYCNSDSRNFMSGMMACGERRGTLGRAQGDRPQRGRVGRGAEHSWLEPAVQGGPEGLPPTWADCACSGPAANMGIKQNTWGAPSLVCPAPRA